jgi:hypothetical protein
MLCTVFAPSVVAQSRFPLTLSMGTHSLTVPWHTGPIDDRLNPVFIAGIERTLRPEGRVRLYQTANFGLFRHYWWMTGAFLETELGVSRALVRGFHADLRLGIGYMHYFWRRKSLKLEDGVYKEATDWGRPSVRIPLSLMLGYRGSSTRPLAVAPYVAAQWAVQTPFIDETPAMTHFLLLLGARIDLGRGTSMAAPKAGS